MKAIQVGLLGIGTVGTGVFNVLKRNQHEILRRAGRGIEITMVHTPGHTPGSQCFLVDGRLVAGDTLFLDGCGRTDLPGSDVEQMYDSLQTLAALPGDTILYPGHRYSPAPSAQMADVRQSNYVFRPRSKEQFLTMFGH